MELVSVVIPNWNGKSFLRDCLTSLKSQTYKNLEILIIDNGSTDGSKEYISKYFKDVKVIPLEKNIGFAPAVNKGIVNSSGDFIFLLNNDTKLHKDCIQYLVKALKDHRDVGMVAAKMLSFYNPELIDSAGDYIDSVGHANNIGMGNQNGKKFNKSGYVFLVTGGGAIFKKKVFQKVGLLDEDYFAYFEDVDLCFRAQLVGFKAWYESKAVILHVHKATSRRIRKFTEYLQYRNMTMTIIKNFPNSLLIHKNNWLKILLVNLNTFKYLISIGCFKEALQAEIYILTHITQLLRKRREIQRSKKVTDEYIINNVRERNLHVLGFEI